MRVSGYRAADALAMPSMLNEPGFREHPQFEEWAARREGSWPAVTLFDGETPMASAGIEDIREGVGELWMYVSIHASRIPKTLAIYSRRVLGGWWEAYGYIRLQALVNADSRVGRRFVEHLGLEPEGTLRRYGPLGNDQIMYARVRDE